MKAKVSIRTNSELSLAEAYEKFQRHAVVTNLAEATVRYYGTCYRFFTQFYQSNELASLRKETVDDYIIFLKSKPELSDTSVNNYLRGLRAIAYFFMSSGYMEPFKIKLIREEERLKNTYTDEELMKLLKKPNIKTCSFPEYRNWVMVSYLVGTGNRSTTLRSLKNGDIDFPNREIKLRKVKNKRQYTIPLSSTLVKVLEEYVGLRKGESEDYLFCSQYGEQITAEGLKTIIQKYNISRGVSKTSIHLFRHTFAKKWILNKGDIFRLQKILGHSSIDIVKKYVNIYGGDLHQDYDEFNPLDNIGRLKEKLVMNNGLRE